MEPLQAVDQHRPVGLVQHIRSNSHGVVGCDADDVAIERSVVQRAQRHAVGNGGNAEGVGVRHDVSRPA